MTPLSRACEVSISIPLQLCLYLVPLPVLSYSGSSNGVTMKLWLGVVSGSLKNGTTRNLGYGFLFAFHSNYGIILYH